MFSYIAREYLFSFFVSFLFFFFLFFINQMLVIARDVLSKQVDLGSTLLLIIFALPAIIALAFPFASLVGALMAVGRFSSDNELTAMQACGFSIFFIFFPIMILALAAAVVSFIMNDYFLPLGTIEYVKLYQNLIFSNSELILQPYSVTRYKSASLVTSNVKSGHFDQILILDSDEKGQQRVISATSGALTRNDAQDGIITLDLNNVFVFDLVRGVRDYDYSFSRQIRYNMLQQNLSNSMRNPGPNEMSSADVYDKISVMESDLVLQRKKLRADLALQKWRFFSEYQRQSDNVSVSGSSQVAIQTLATGINEIKLQEHTPVMDRNLQLFWIQYWKKYSIPAACFTLIFLGFPAGMFAKRSGRSVGFGIGFIIAAVFWAMLIIGESIGMDNLSLSPFLLMWAPNILFFVVGIIMLLRRVMR